MLKLSNSNIHYSEKFVNKILHERFKTFELQDPANDHFDVTFEIEGKNIYTNKFILTSASETMVSMLSDRWTMKDEPVKIETYSYDNFYEFLRFLYTGGCNLTNENVFKLTDMAEFYAVPFLKELCHTFLLKMEYNVGRIEEMVEFSEKYSLNRMKGALKVFVRCNLDKIVSRKRFLSSGKLFVEIMSLNNQYSQKEKESVFEAVYKWTENQVLKQKNTEDENFNLFEAVKDELSVVFPHIYALDKSAMNYDFLMNFMVNKGFFLSPNELKILYERYRMNSLIEDICFRTVFNLAEKQALQRQKLASFDENFNLVDSIKADLCEVIKIAKFYQMQNSFLIDFVFAKGIITAEQARHVDDTRGYSIYGIKCQNTTLLRLLEMQFKVPITASKLKYVKCVKRF